MNKYLSLNGFAKSPKKLFYITCSCSLTFSFEQQFWTFLLKAEGATLFEA